MSNHEAERERFEAAVSGPPYEYSTVRYPDDATRYSWPGNYRNIAVELAWDMWSVRAAEAEAVLTEALRERDALREALIALDNDWTSFWPLGPDVPQSSTRVAAIGEETAVIWRQIRAALSLSQEKT